MSEPWNLTAAKRNPAPSKLWRCEDCGWPWPLPGKPPAGAECDNCGGELTTEG